jgi:hypothetical protein
MSTATARATKSSSLSDGNTARTQSKLGCKIDLSALISSRQYPTESRAIRDGTARATATTRGARVVLACGGSGSGAKSQPALTGLLVIANGELTSRLHFSPATIAIGEQPIQSSQAQQEPTQREQ